MPQLTAVRSRHEDEWRLRIDLAASFRLAAEFGWHEGVANHFSVAVSDDGRKFLMNPKWKHFSTIRASDLLLLDADDPATMRRPHAPDPSAWCIHGTMHMRRPAARCVIHLHPPYATAIASLADPDIKPIDQNTARYYNRLAIDLDYGGIADDTDEGERIVRVIGNKRRMMMGNHGILVTGNTVAEAFDDVYYLERSCRTLVLAYSTGQKLNLMPHELAERTARDWEDYRDAPAAHFDELKRLIEAKDPSFAQ